MPISVSISSNVPRFTDTKHIVKDCSQKQLVVDMIDYMLLIQKEIMKKQVALIIQQLEDRIECVKTSYERLNLRKVTHKWHDGVLATIESGVAGY